MIQVSFRRFIKALSVTFLFLAFPLIPLAFAQYNDNSGSISGFVNGPDGKKFAGAVVSVEADGKVRSTRTDSNGYYVIQYLSPVTYRLTVSAPGKQYPAVVYGPVKVKTNRNEDIQLPDITLGRARVEGLVISKSEGHRLSGVTVTAICVGNFSMSKVTDEQGVYVLPYIPVGTCTINASKSDYHEKTIPNVVIPNSEKVTGPIFSLSPIRRTGMIDGPADQSGRYERAATDEFKGRDVPTFLTASYKSVAGESDPKSDESSSPSTTGQVETGTLSGRVVDRASNGLPGVTATMTNLENGGTRTTLTDDYGFFVFARMLPGRYKIVASKPGYVSAEITDFLIRLSEDTALPVPIVLSPLGTTTTPPTTATQEAGYSSLINKSDVSRGQNFDAQTLRALPIGGTTNMRTFDEMALLVAGVAPPPYPADARGPGIGIGFSLGTTGEFAINGMRARSNNFTVDGSDNNDAEFGLRRQGYVDLVPQPLESIQEFQISTLLWNADLGRNFGSQVNAVSKSGGSKYHGEVYLFFTDSRLNARNFFDYIGGKDPLTRTQAGFILGGPLVPSRSAQSQFFVSFEQQNINASTEQQFSTPTKEQRRFLGLPRFVVKTSESADGRFGVTSGATPLGNTILSFYPLPNNPIGPYGANTYTEILPADGEGSIFSIKLTPQIKQNSLSARYNFTNDDLMLPSVNRAIRSTVKANTRSQNLSFILDSALSLGVFNQARFSFGRTRVEFSEYPTSPFILSARRTEVVETPIGPREVSSSTGPIGQLIVEPFSPVGLDAFSFPQGRANNVFQYANVTSWTKNSHSLKLGGDLRRVQLNNFQDRLYRPLVIYGSGINPDPLSDTGKGTLVLSGAQYAALGVPSSIFQTLTLKTPDSTIGLRVSEFNFFFNDNWRIRQNLICDYGLRYEYNTVPNEVNGRIEKALKLENLPPVGNSRFNNDGRIFIFKEAVNAYSEVLDGREKIYEPDYNNFGPHIGLVWANNRMAARTGYGIYYDKIPGAVVSQSRNVFPNEIPLNILPRLSQQSIFNLNNPSFFIFTQDGRFNETEPLSLIAPDTLNQFGGASEDFAALVGALFVSETVFGNAASLAFTLPEKRLRTPYAQQWHLTLESEIIQGYLVSAAYVGTKGTKLLRLSTPNLGPNLNLRIIKEPSDPLLPVFSPILDLSQIRRPNRRIGAYRVFATSAASSYQALQIELRNRYARHKSFTLAYTWSHAIDDVSDIFAIGGAPILPQNSRDLLRERANANYDVSHRLSFSMFWNLFDGYVNGPGRWLGGWRLGTIFQASTGQPFTLNIPVDANLDGNITDRPLTTTGLSFVKRHDPRRVIANRNVEDFFITGQDGIVGRNTVRGDSFINWDISVNKEFRISEYRNIEVRTDFFNILNRANFGLPVRTIGTPGFGTSVDTVNPARIIQFAVKYSF
jgi:hypothetical protein